VRPPIPGLESKKVFTLRNMTDTDAIKAFVKGHKLGSAVVIGAGFIGLEMAENLHHLGAKVAVVEALPQVMNVVDPEIAATVALHMREKGVDLYLSQSVTSIREGADGLEISLSSGKVLKSEMAILSIGVKPESTLAKMAGLKLGERGGIWVNEFMQTSDAHIYAAGDAVETKNLVTGKFGITPLAGPANKQGRLVADNIVFGNTRKFEGTVGTGIAKVFDIAVGATGANEKLLRAEGIPFESVLIHPGSHAGYYPGAQTVTIKMLFSPVDGRILGAQAVGLEGVDRRLDVFALAVHKGLTVSDLEEYEHVYAPPFSGAKDPVNLAAYVASNIVAGRLKTITQTDVRNLSTEANVLIDVRTPGEVARGTIPGAINVPVDELRQRLNDIPRGKPVVVFCAVGLRAYVATRILLQSGFQDVKSVSGGYYTYRQLAAL
jgi:NADPH-dependent 2,4-dienoyl-CoA reductase/sulfur reductase-like enzyme/rhodanese-related sulfurtransferase